MNGDTEHICDEMNRYILLLRNERDVEVVEKFLDKMVDLIEQQRKLAK